MLRATNGLSVYQDLSPKNGNVQIVIEIGN